jgi:hypothetical protein
MFEGNPDVAFGDVLLSEQQIRGNVFISTYLSS